MGVRITCVLDRDGGDDVRYAIEIRDETLTRGAATVAKTSGEVAFEPWAPTDPEAETVRLTRAFLRAAWSATRKPSPDPWPRKIDRWRS